MQQLLKREVLKWVPKSEVPVDANILRTKWVLVVKNAESDNPIYKARLVLCSEVKSHLRSHLLTPESRLYTQHTNRHPEVASSNTLGEGDGCKGKQDL
jgi:hypothetical protein